jgi:hypothetical protein
MIEQFASKMVASGITAILQLLLQIPLLHALLIWLKSGTPTPVHGLAHQHNTVNGWELLQYQLLLLVQLLLLHKLKLVTQYMTSKDVLLFQNANGWIF